MSGIADEAAAASTLILTRRAIAALMSPSDYLEAVETGFRAAAEGNAHSPPPMEIEGAGGNFHGKGASLRLDRFYVALKLNGNFPDNPDVRGLPTIQGAILLCDGETGSLLAMMDSIEVTLRRTAAATALAARHLARPDAETVLMCGCGSQALPQIEELEAVLPLRRCFAWDREPERAEALALALRQRGGWEAATLRQVGEAAPSADVIVTCTTSRSPFLTPEMVREGTFVAAVGADSPDKSEVAPELMARSLVVADVLAQCLAMGDLRHSVEAGAMTVDAVSAELGDLVTGVCRGRTDKVQITLFDSTGTALQDVAAAAMIYEKARQQPSTLSVDLGSA